MNTYKVTKMGRDPWSTLYKIYSDYLTSETKPLFTKQKKERTLDRCDVTILLSLYAHTTGHLDMEQDYIIKYANGSTERKQKHFPLEYSLIVVDEFQNYLPAQLKLIRSTSNKQSKSIIYVGDLAQQIRLGTIRDWSQIHEKIAPDRLVSLQKVYRNTQEILEYIRTLGYPVTIPEQIKHGVPVVEKICATETEELLYLKQISLLANNNSVGILCLNESRVEALQQTFASSKQIRVMSVHEAQGVEFDIVCILGTNSLYASIVTDMPQEFITQQIRIQKDLLYVALTRAISELHILCQERLSSVLPLIHA
jgi:DNA helicase IV